jgi:membrane protein implicated in regulation of membrane protease activity
LTFHTLPAAENLVLTINYARVNMSLPKGCGALLFDSFRVLLFVTLSVLLAAMLWRLVRERLTSARRLSSATSPVLITRERAG